MKTKKFFPAILFLTFLFSPLSAQNLTWDSYMRLTSGYIDRNPTFATKHISNYGLSGSELLVFERGNMAGYWNICALKMGLTGILDSVIYLTSGNNINRNPSVSYNTNNTLNKAVVVFESYVNGRWNIYSRIYNSGTWSGIQPIDTSAGDKNKPCVLFQEAASSSMYYIVTYQKNNDIILKKVDGTNNALMYDTNLTYTDTAICRNPGLTKDNSGDYSYYVFYERQKPNGEYAIYFRKAAMFPTWSQPDTIAYLGNNRNVKAFSGYPSAVNFSFESNRSGKWGIYQTYWNYNSYVQSLVYKSTVSNCFNLVTFLFPIITDAGAWFSSYARQDADSTRITSGTGLPPSQGTFAVGDSSLRPALTMGNGILSGSSYVKVWLVYNKDSAGYSMLYTRGKNVNTGGIKQISGETPGGFALSQNYPNPFNQSTIFNLQSSKKSMVTLKVYDISGREVSVLVNEILNPGVYEIRFDGGDLPSGTYFYRLITDYYSETRRMVMVK
jgi:hypothetical protein